jgi:hypothetical protein
LAQYALYFKRDGHAVAIVGQPHSVDGSLTDVCELLVDGFVLHTPPAGPYASLCAPGHRLFLVLTRPLVEVRWLPEQQTKPRSLYASDPRRHDEEDAKEVSALLVVANCFKTLLTHHENYCCVLKTGNRHDCTCEPTV